MISANIGKLMFYTGEAAGKLATVTVTFNFKFGFRFSVPGNKMNKGYDHVWFELFYPRLEFSGIKRRTLYVTKPSSMARSSIRER